MTPRQYILQRVAELDKLIAEQIEGSVHQYALNAGKFELLRLASSLKL